MPTFQLDQLPPEHRAEALRQMADAKRPSPGPGERPVTVQEVDKRRKSATWHGSEHDLQVAVFEWAANSGIPELDMMYAVPNGGHRHKAVAVRMKAEGVKPGYPDINLDVMRGGYGGLRIELKVGRNKPSQAQLEWLARLGKHGYKTALCYDLEQAQTVIVDYLNGRFFNAKKGEK